MIDDTNKDEATVEETEEVVTNEVVTDEVVTDEAGEEVTEVTETVPAALTVQDLANLRNIIDIASQRGAFKTNEFAVVGATYTKLSNFINAITPTNTEAKDDTAEETTEETAEVSGDE